MKEEERPWPARSPDSRGGGSGGGGRWKREEGGAGRSGGAWGLEARESRGAGPERRGKSQGPGEAVLGEGRAGRAEPGVGGPREKRSGGEGTGSGEAADPGSVGKPGSGEPRGPGERRW